MKTGTFASERSYRFIKGDDGHTYFYGWLTATKFSDGMRVRFNLAGREVNLAINLVLMDQEIIEP
jgi:hypothetical protein